MKINCFHATTQVQKNRECGDFFSFTSPLTCKLSLENLFSFDFTCYVNIVFDIIFRVYVALRLSFLTYPADIYLCQLNKGNTGTMWNLFKVINKGTRRTSLTPFCRSSFIIDDVVIVIFKQVSLIVLVFLLLVWTNECWLVIRFLLLELSKMVIYMFYMFRLDHPRSLQFSQSFLWCCHRITTSCQGFFRLTDKKDPSYFVFKH